MVKNNFWKNNPDKYKRHKKKMLEYSRSERGKIVRSKANKKFKAKNPNYLKEYMKKRRQECREKGLCTRCLKRPKKDEKSFICQYCADMASQKYENK
ncbi:hypothetical protein KY343_06875 [Candidatus Woesearchaeota archaeon]|nr:hypothetical protein [Candidatus Woesearchaeota archaeon]